MFSIIKKIISFCVIPFILVSSLPCSAVDLTTNKEQVEEFYESMLSKKVLLGEQGSEQALQEYYANQEISDQNKRELSVVAQLINYFTDDVLGDYYQQWINGFLDIPEGGVSTAILDDSYGQYTGFYKTSADSQPYSCSFKPSATGVIVSSSHFSLSVRWEPVAFDVAGRDYQVKPYYRWNSYGRYEIGSEFDYNISGSTTSFVYRILEGTGGFSSSSGRTQVRQINSSSSSGTGSVFCFVQLGVGTSLPVLDITNLSGKINASSFNNLASWGSIVKLPEGDLTQEPWDYFNTKFLPWVKGECENLGFDYKKICPYPNGYLVRDPQEPYPVPTAPNGTPIYNITYPTEIVTEYVTDDNGEPVTDSNGEPVTETVYETMTDTNGQPITETELATVPSDFYDAEYSFDIPGLPELPTDYTVPEMELPDSSILAGIGGLFQAVGSVLESSGIFGILPFVFFTAFLIYLLAKIGG